jgi:2-octaprenyl-6-methoxyphenol hydroxylase
MRMRYKDNMESRIYDVAIIGGGLAGLTLACLLARTGVSVVCIDSAPMMYKVAAQVTDLRTTAISYGSRKILEKAGIWPYLANKTCAIYDIRILDDSSPVLLNFLQTEVEDKAFGWIVENALLRSAQLEEALKQGVQHIAPAKVEGFEVGADSVTVNLQGRTPVKTYLVVGADGRNSFVRGWMGVRAREWSYRQRAVICTVAHENSHDNVAVEHFRSSGPFAVLPMCDAEDGTHRSSVILTEHGPQSKSFMNQSDEEFNATLNTLFPAEYGRVHLLGKRACYPLGLIHAAEYVGPRMVLVADAAHAIHPIAGQGLNLGFRDVAELAELISSVKASGRDVGAPELLATYQRRRRPDNMAMVAVTDGLNRLFSNNILPVRLLRQAGLKAVARLPAAKRFFMRQAMGDR